MNIPKMKNPLGTLEKIVATGGVLVGAAAIVGAGAFAVFTSTGAATIAADAGALKVALSENYTIDNIAPGDSVYRSLPIELPATGSAGNLVSAVGFYFDTTNDVVGTVGSTGKSLVSGANGLTYRILTCSVPWVASTAAIVTVPYECTGAETNTTPALVAAQLSTVEGVANVREFGPSDFGKTPTASGTFNTDTTSVNLYSMIEFALPEVANNDYQNASVDLAFTVAAMQRSGTKS